MKASLLLPGQSFDTINFWILFTIVLGCFVRIVYVRWSKHRKKKKETIWIAVIFLLVLGIDLENPISFAIFLPPLLSSFLQIFKKSEDEEESVVHLPESEQIDCTSIIQENTLLKRRVLDTPKTFFSQATFFENLITLNEIQLVQSVVESSTNFLSANQVSLYKYEKHARRFSLTSRYNRSTGLQLGSHENIEDRIFYLITEAKRTLTIREISRNKKLYQLWQNSTTKAMVYSPIYFEDELIGVLTIDDIDWLHFHRDTVRNIEVISKLTGHAFRNITAHQSLLAQNNSDDSSEFTEFHRFLKEFNSEFKRAIRNKIPLSVLLVSLEVIHSEHSTEEPDPVMAHSFKESCLNNLREVDLLFEGEKSGQLWVVLPFTDFDGLSYVMERINLITKMDLSDQAQFACHFGFSSLYPGLQKPRQMITACQDSLQLHKTVSELVYIKKVRAENSDG